MEQAPIIDQLAIIEGLGGMHYAPGSRLGEPVRASITLPSGLDVNYPVVPSELSVSVLASLLLVSGGKGFSSLSELLEIAKTDIPLMFANSGQSIDDETKDKLVKGNIRYLELASDRTIQDVDNHVVTMLISDVATIAAYDVASYIYREYNLRLEGLPLVEVIDDETMLNNLPHEEDLDKIQTESETPEQSVKE